MSLGASGCGYEYRNTTKHEFKNKGYKCPHLENGNYCTKYHQCLKTTQVAEFVNKDTNCLKTVQVDHPIRLKICGA